MLKIENDEAKDRPLTLRAVDNGRPEKGQLPGQTRATKATTTAIVAVVMVRSHM